MRPSHAQLATLIIAGLLAAAACVSAASPAPIVTPGAAPSNAVTTSSPSVAPGATTLAPSAAPSATHQPTLPPTPIPAPPTPIPAPPKPSGVKFDQQVRLSDDGEVATVTQTVKWRTPRVDSIEIRVYGVTACIDMPASPPPGTSGPCLVEHTPLPASLRTPLARAPASDGVVSWTWTQGGGDCEEPFYDPAGPPYHAVVLAAYGASGHSIFAIAEPGGWWTPAAGDIVC